MGPAPAPSDPVSWIHSRCWLRKTGACVQRGTDLRDRLIGLLLDRLEMKKYSSDRLLCKILASGSNLELPSFGHVLYALEGFCTSLHTYPDDSL